MSIQTIVIVGAGQAGASAILELRAQQFSGEIILIGDEPHLPYERPPLSKDAILQPEQTKLEILSEQKLAELNVKVIRNNAVVKLQPEAHQLVLKSGDVIHYDKLLLATGGSARRLPMLDALGQHVYTLRNLEDSQKLIPVLQPEKRILIVGGGVIGLELASSARAKGCQVTVLEQGAMVMGRCSPLNLSQFLLQQHQRAGIEIQLNTKLVQAELRDQEVILTLENGQQLTGDAVIYGIGIVPNADLACEAGLDVDFAIRVNQYCQTSDPDIYAAGDVATQLVEDGQYRRIETWENANKQAGIFARHAMGNPLAQQTPAWFWTDQLDMNFQFVGDMTATEWHIRGEMDIEQGKNASFVMFGTRNGILVAGITVNQAKETRHLKKMIAKAQPFDAETLLNLAIDLRKVA
ncbi:phenylpropionate dioxygenase ferredoxin reductase subunit [Acinetobacter sp. ANC 4633]|uniref:3-phenylpropionate/cinnamic acid dioxygenase ferredoxin--NAD(+) reductase subunit n=1 Tax=Acinetobacter sp. ANC 4633 TaxID=2529845 RepID=UPI00103FB4C2|nr:3-phenylpropionate/cinnamic acid dioxygenase ferredoxin--NAD(+) reductase subunit [Acinetobacter sp. ANC 4633]TCB24331.1 phenylpropionate dioxygenase ferredoxin reductase subunit [Acinetobacter sp. ANC 4633]